MEMQSFQRICLRKIYTILTLATIAFLFSTGTNAQETTLKVAMAHYPPWKIINEDGSVSGIDADILNRIGEKLNIRFEFVACPWKRCVSMMKDGHVDLITNFALTKERLEFSHYIMPPYAIQQTVLYVQKGNKDLIRSYPDIHKSIIGTVKGAHIFERLHIDPQIQCVEVTQQTQLLEMLKNNRVSAILGIETNLNYQIITEGYSGMFERAAYTPPDAYGVHFAISKHSRHNNLEPQIERELTNLLQEGEVSRVIDNYIRE